MKSTGIIPTSENVYDGNWHHWELSGMDSNDDGFIDGSDVTPLIKFRITRDSNGKISEFKMFSCFGDNSGGPVQTEYISQTFSGSSAVVTSKYAGAEAGPGGTHTFGSEVTASGAVNSNGQWISKNLVSRSSYQGPMMQSFNMYMNMNQYSDYLTLSGYQNGNYSFGGTTFNFDTKMDSYIELLNAGSLSDLSLGHGSSKVDVSMGDGSSTYTDNNLIESWSGDTRDVILSGPYESNVSSASLISSSSSGPVSFSMDEQWNCDVSSASATSANMSPGNLMATNMDDAMLACEYKFGAGDQWIDCSDVLGPP